MAVTLVLDPFVGLGGEGLQERPVEALSMTEVVEHTTSTHETHSGGCVRSILPGSRKKLTPVRGGRRGPGFVVATVWQP